MENKLIWPSAGGLYTFVCRRCYTWLTVEDWFNTVTFESVCKEMVPGWQKAEKKIRLTLGLFLYWPFQNCDVGIYISSWNIKLARMITSSVNSVLRVSCSPLPIISFSFACCCIDCMYQRGEWQLVVVMRLQTSLLSNWNLLLFSLSLQDVCCLINPKCCCNFLSPFRTSPSAWH